MANAVSHHVTNNGIRLQTDDKKVELNKRIRTSIKNTLCALFHWGQVASTISFPDFNTCVFGESVGQSELELILSTSAAFAGIFVQPLSTWSGSFLCDDDWVGHRLPRFPKCHWQCRNARQRVCVEVWVRQILLFLQPQLLLLLLLLAIDESHYLCAWNLTPQRSAGVLFGNAQWVKEAPHL